MAGPISRRFFMACGCMAVFSAMGGDDALAARRRHKRAPAVKTPERGVPLPPKRPSDMDQLSTDTDVLAAPVDKKLVPAPQADDRVLKFYNTHTDESLSAVYRRAGGYDHDGMLKISTVLRDHRRKGAASITDMKPELMDLLSEIKGEIETRYPGKDVVFEVISGYRSLQSNNALRRRKNAGQAKDSAHTRGQAIDIRVAGVPRDELRNIAWSMGRGGVGDYRGLDFVHVDVWDKKTADKDFPGGQRMRAWGWTPKPPGR